MTLSAPLHSGTGFVALGGGVTGRDHRRAHRDGQDGFALVATPDVTAAIVTDGCSSGATSEVGARLGAAWLAELVARLFPSDDPVASAREVTSRLVERIDVAARSLSPAGAVCPDVLGEMFLFGYLVAVVSGEWAIVFGVGDGLAWVDGRTTVIDPGPENAPIYPAYALLGASIAPRVIHRGRAAEVDTLAVATDGAAELLASERAPSLEALVRDERFLRNPSLLRKQLVVLSNGGRFWDDATIGVVRRRA